jgi:lactoylglutathione lyase
MAKKTTKKTKKAGNAPRKGARKRASSVGRESEGIRLRSAEPGFTVNDIEKSLAWYRDVLGFKTKERWERDGKLAGVEVKAGSVSFMLGQDDWKKGRDRVKGEGFRMYCETLQDVDRLARGIKARGGTLLQEPTDEPWGVRDFAVLDPDGFKITVQRARRAGRK